MSSQIPSVDERMALSRTFGHVQEDTYSPAEYAAVVGPILEARLRSGPIGVANSYLEPHNRGVNLTVVCERTFNITPSNPGTPVNRVLHESGQPMEKDFSKFIGELFQAADKLESVTLNDQLGNTFTITRKDAPKPQQESAAKSGPLDLSMLEEGKGKPNQPSFSKAPLTSITESEKARGAKMYKKGYRYRIDFSSDIEPLYVKSINDATQLMKTVYKDEKNWKATEIDSDGSDKKKESQSFSRASGESGALNEDVRQFLGEKVDFAGAADKLLKDSQIGNTPRDIGYGSYLRRKVVGKKCGHLLKSDNPEIAAGAVAAREDVTRLANAMK